jgi:hypothetical protein
MNTLKTALLTFGLMATAVSFSQEKQTEKVLENSPKMKTDQRKIGVEEKSARQTERLAEQLLLTPEQKIKVQELNLTTNKKDEQVRLVAEQTPEQKKEAMQKNNNAKREQMKIILTTEQYEKYLAIETRTQHREEYSKQAPPPAPAQKAVESEK